MIAAAYAFIYLIVFIIGACVFSFLNVVIYRVPRKIPIYKGFSFCPSCGARIMPRDLVPVINRIYLHGKCRSCGSPISARYQITELCGGIAAILCAVRFDIVNGGILRAAVAFAAVCVLVCVALIDIDTMEIPDRLHIALAVVALAAAAVFPEIGIIERIIGFFIISVPMLIIALIVPGGFGGGDIKLMAPAGFLLGWKVALCAFFIAVIIGGAQGIFMLITKKVKKGGHFAFGPALCAGVTAALFAGEYIVDWYISLLR